MEPTNPNRERPVADLTNGRDLFVSKTLALGDTHIVLDDNHREQPVPCGHACPWRLQSISCPFFAAPCLVGSRVKQTLSGDGYAYEELDMFVVAQHGRYLIGEEIILNLDNPRASKLRMVTNKRGMRVHARSSAEGESLLDRESGMVLTGEVELGEEEGSRDVDFGIEAGGSGLGGDGQDPAAKDRETIDGGDVQDGGS